jgi:hypothetical protein
MNSADAGAFSATTLKTCTMGGGGGGGTAFLQPHRPSATPTASSAARAGPLIGVLGTMNRTVVERELDFIDSIDSFRNDGLLYDTFIATQIFFAYSAIVRSLENLQGTMMSRIVLHVQLS